MNTFNESQRFRQWWLWVGLAVVNFILLLDLQADPTSWDGLVIGVLIALLFYIWRLDTRLDAKGIHYRIFPILPWRTISWKSVQSVSVRIYAFVGYGIRWGFEGWVYNIAGNKGLRIIYANGRRITIGTQRPDELQHFLDQQYVQHC